MEFLRQEGQFVSGFVDEFGSWFARSVACARFDSDQHRVVARLGFLKSGGKFEAMRGNDTVIVIGGSDQRGRIFHSTLDMMQWRISVKGLELRRIFGGTIIARPGPADCKFVKA